MVLSKDFKFAICFGLIIGVILSVCNLCFASEVEVVTPNSLSNIGFTSEGIVVSSSGTAAYIAIEPGYVYHFKNELTSNTRFVGFSNKIIEAGDVLSDVSVIQAQETFDFSYNEFNYIYFNVNSISSISITREAMPGMSNFIDNIAYALSFENLSSVWLFVVPLLTISVLFGLGFFIGIKIVDKFNKARGGL